MSLRVNRTCVDLLLRGALVRSIVRHKKETFAGIVIKKKSGSGTSGKGGGKKRREITSI